MLQLIRALEKAYVISVNSVEDIKNLYKSLGLVRSLLMVQVAPDEEDILKTSIWYEAGFFVVVVVVVVKCTTD